MYPYTPSGCFSGSLYSVKLRVLRGKNSSSFVICYMIYSVIERLTLIGKTPNRRSRAESGLREEPLIRL